MMMREYKCRVIKMCLYVRDQQLEIIIYVSCAHILSCIQLFATPWTVACQVLLSMEFSRHEYYSGLPFPTPGYLPLPGIKPMSLVLSALAADSSPRQHLGSHNHIYMVIYKPYRNTHTHKKNTKIYNRYTNRIEIEKRKVEKSSLQSTRDKRKQSPNT